MLVNNLQCCSPSIMKLNHSWLSSSLIYESINSEYVFSQELALFLYEYIFCCNVYVDSQGWLGSRDTAIHSGEGPIAVARWHGHFIAWANDKGVKVNSQHYVVCVSVTLIYLNFTSLSVFLNAIHAGMEIALWLYSLLDTTDCDLLWPDLCFLSDSRR